MSIPSPAVMRICRTALWLYPSRFRREYERQILQALVDSHRDAQSGSANFWARAFTDLLMSAARERMLVGGMQMIKHPVYFHALTLGFILTVLGGGASLTVQQMLRRGANQPQAEMADSYASKIFSGATVEDSIPTAQVDLERDLQPFVIFYDEHGQPKKSSGYLDRMVPTPPRGVFEYAQNHGSDTLTWQPRPGVRIASVIRYIAGPHPGYLLAGRSLRLTEEYESLLWRIAFSSWFAVVFLLALGAILLSRAQRATLATV